MPELIDSLEVELQAYQLDYVNRLRQISTVSDISLGEMKSQFIVKRFVSRSLQFKVCGIQFQIQHINWEGNEGIGEECVLGYYLASTSEPLIDTLERWQKEQEDDAGLVEERFRI